MQECSLVFEELQETHAQYAVPGYLNRFSKLYESHFEALCTALDANVSHINLLFLILSCHRMDHTAISKSKNKLLISVPP